MFSFASETFTFTAEGSCGRYAVTWYGWPTATRPVVQPVRSKSEPPAPSKMNRETCRICSILEKLEGTLSTDCLVVVFPNFQIPNPGENSIAKSKKDRVL